MCCKQRNGRQATFCPPPVFTFSSGRVLHTAQWISKKYGQGKMQIKINSLLRFFFCNNPIIMVPRLSFFYLISYIHTIFLLLPIFKKSFSSFSSISSHSASYCYPLLYHPPGFLYFAQLTWRYVYIYFFLICFLISFLSFFSLRAYLFNFLLSCYSFLSLYVSSF